MTPDDGPRTRAVAVHREAYVFDAHVDTAHDALKGRPLGERSNRGHVDLPRLVEGGVDAQIFAIFVDARRHRGQLLVQALELLHALRREFAAHPEALTLVRRASDLDEARRTGRLAAILAVEGGEVLEGSLAVLHALYELGVRSLGLTWNYRNELADGVGEPEAGGGLTRFGRQVVAEMARLGMVVDVSHLGERAFWQVLEVYDGPLIASHSNARAVCPHPRNLTDAQLQALAERGGVTGMNFNPPFLRPEGPATVEDVVRHVDHIVGLIGPEHIGLGSDFDGITSTPVDLPDVSHLPRITEALLAAGYGEPDIRRILGENFDRVFRRVLG